MDDYDYTAFDDSYYIEPKVLTNTKDKLLSLYKTDGKATHTFMNGGKLNIPYDKLNEVYNILENNKENPPLTERINAYGDTFKFFIDVDDENVDIEELINITEITLQKLFILTDKQKRYTIWINSNNQNKYHIIWQFKCDKKDAINCIKLITRDFKYEADESVYSSGLRLPYCNKDTIKDKNNSIYEYKSGYKSSVLKSGSILFTDKILDLKYTDKYIQFIDMEKTEKSNDETPLSLVDDNKLNNVLNRMFDVSYNWKAEPSSNGFKITHNGNICLVDNTKEHEDREHSCLFIHKRSCIATCFSHTKNKILIKDYPELIDLKEVLGLVEKNNKKNKIELLDKSKRFHLTIEDIEYMNTLINTTHEDISKVLYRFYGNIFICGAEVPKPVWFKYKKGIWKEMDGTSALNKIISNYLHNIYLTLYNIYIEEAENTTLEIFSNTDRDEFFDKSNICKEIYTKLKTHGFIESILKQCIHYFKVENFIEKLDYKGNLLCFGEDVYDLDINEWRKTEQEDYCSKKCGLTKDEITEDNIEEFNELFNNIFPSEDRRNYFLNLICETLYGGNTKEIFQIWTGVGRNGKGLFMKYLEACLGDYFYSSDVSYLTQKSRPNGTANSELAQARGVRIWSFTEPSQGAKLNNSLMKSLTCGDNISARQLFQKSFSFVPHFTPIIQCNTSFGLQDVADDSIPDRLEFVKFITHFVDNPIKENERKKIEGIKTTKFTNKIKGCLMFILLNRWNNLSKVNFKYEKPLEVKDDKQEFIDDNDDVKQFLEYTIDIVENKEAIIKTKDLYDDYKSYFNDKTGYKCKMNLKTFISRSSRHIYFKERLRINGKDYRSVFINCSYKTEDNNTINME